MSRGSDLFPTTFNFLSDIRTVLDNMHRFMQAQAAGNLYPLRLVCMAVRMIRLPQATLQLENWRRLFSCFAARIEESRFTRSEDDIRLAESSIQIIHALECNDAIFLPGAFYIPEPLDVVGPDEPGYFPVEDERSYEKWRDCFDERRSLFPDDFVYVLWTIARKETRWYRVRRLTEAGYKTMAP